MTRHSWGNMDPNSEHQIWSHWTFQIIERGRHVPQAELEINARKWLRQTFGSVGHGRIAPTLYGWKIEAQVEGVPAHDPGYVKAISRALTKFAEAGWGPIAATTDLSVRIMAGDEQRGDPSKQLVVMDGRLSE